MSRTSLRGCGSPRVSYPLYIIRRAKFCRKAVMPEKTTIAIAGDVKPSEARRLADKYFAQLPARPLPPLICPPGGRDDEGGAAFLQAAARADSPAAEARPRSRGSGASGTLRHRPRQSGWASRRVARCRAGDADPSGARRGVAGDRVR